MILTINPKFADRKVSHHNVCKTIAEHTPEELMDLAIEARKSNNPLLVECFDDLPQLPALMSDKTNVQIATAQQATTGLSKIKDETPKEAIITPAK